MKDVPVAMPTWSGFYLGGGVGYGHLIARTATMRMTAIVVLVEHSTTVPPAASEPL